MRRGMACIGVLVVCSHACSGEGDEPDAGSSPVVDASFRCGNGVVEGVEQCDESDLAGQSCASVGFIAGTLGCDLITCRFDTRGCESVETLRNDDGSCDNLELGCSNPEGTQGNPQSMVECFDQTRLGAPFVLREVDYVVGTTIPASDSLDVEVYEWSGAGPPGAQIVTIPLDAENLVTGPHTVALVEPVEIPTATFCVGFGATDPADAFRLRFSGTATDSAKSWMLAGTCGADAFVESYSIFPAELGVTMGNLCLGVTIDKLAVP